MTLTDTEMTNLVALVSAAVGAFLGSGCAFVLEAMRRNREETEARHCVLFRTQFVLITQLNTLLNIQKLYLDKHREDPQRFMLLVPFHSSPTDLRIDFGSLWFVPLIDGDVDLTHRLYLAEQGYKTAIDALGIRNQKMEETYFADGAKVQSFEFETGRALVEIDARKALILSKVTDGLYVSVDTAIIQVEKAICDLRAVINRAYPGKKSFEYRRQSEKPAPSKGSGTKAMEK